MSKRRTSQDERQITLDLQPGYTFPPSDVSPQVTTPILSPARKIALWRLCGKELRITVAQLRRNVARYLHQKEGDQCVESPTRG